MLFTSIIEILESILSQDHLPKSKSEEAEVTNSTTAPFSHCHMMYHKSLLGSTTIGSYGSGIGTCAIYLFLERT
ncbi:DUF3231 family protein [Neobacillus driksii]|uniref:DUF3231 family protein n=1 Tax=Neobacillus driksii TaxID=3035913 RepID=UPI003593F53F